MTNLFCDLDGTLLDVSERYYTLYRDIMRNLGQSVLSEGDYWRLKRSGLPEAQIISRTTSDAGVVARYGQIRDPLMEAPAYLRLDRLIVPELLQILTELAVRYRLYLVTLRRHEERLLDELEALNLRASFSAILVRGQTNLRREAPAWEVKARLIGEAAAVDSSSLVVGDTEADILAGKALGLKTYAVLSGLRDRNFLVRLGPDAVMEDVAELYHLIFTGAEKRGSELNEQKFFGDDVV
jgi:phosphoglycolate phosphatase-like HAD superfamily hydrolase